jgi:ribosomal protein S18 acetylase RimI-like enzyme
VAECDGRVVAGLMITYEWSDWRNGLFWWIQSVYVRPEFRRRGIYRKMYAHIRQAASMNGNVCGLRLYVERDNQSAQTTYASLGMSKTHYLIFETTKIKNDSTK